MAEERETQMEIGHVLFVDIVGYSTPQRIDPVIAVEQPGPGKAAGAAAVRSRRMLIM